MMGAGVIPGPWVGLVMALGVFRIVRLIGWDDFPPVEWVRDKVVGAHVVNHGSTNARMGVTNEDVEHVVTYRRPTLHKFLSCPYCQGAWWSLAAYACWRWADADITVAVLFVAGLSGAVGIIGRMLDP